MVEATLRFGLPGSQLPAGMTFMVKNGGGRFDAQGLPRRRLKPADREELAPETPSAADRDFTRAEVIDGHCTRRTLVAD
jgi:hypothetical protein